MVQSSVGIDQDAQYEGRLVYPNLPNEVTSKVVGETNGLNFGRVAALDSAGKLRALRSNQITLTFDADTVTSNTIDGDLVINGTSASIAQVTFNTDHATTMGLIESALEALSGVASATVGPDSSGNANRVITVALDAESDGYAENFVVAAGASQANIAEANDDDSEFYGVTLFAQIDQNNDGTALYEDEVTASVGRDVYIDVRSDDALALGDDVYVRFFEESADDKKAGMLAASAGSAPARARLWSNAKVERACAAGGIATIRVRL